MPKPFRFPTKPNPGERCVGRRIVGPKFREVPCRALATRVDTDFRWGRDGEPAIVHVRFPLCPTCAARADENAAEARAEARS